MLSLVLKIYSFDNVQFTVFARQRASNVIYTKDDEIVWTAIGSIFRPRSSREFLPSILQRALRMRYASFHTYAIFRYLLRTGTRAVAMYDTWTRVHGLRWLNDNVCRAEFKPVRLVPFVKSVRSPAGKWGDQSKPDIVCETRRGGTRCGECRRVLSCSCIQVKICTSDFRKSIAFIPVNAFSVRQCDFSSARTIDSKTFAIHIYWHRKLDSPK